MDRRPWHDPAWWFGIGMMVLAAAALVSALRWEPMAATFPIFVCAVILVCGVIHTAAPFLRPPSGDDLAMPPPLGPTALYAAWIAGFFALAVAFGFPIAAPAFVLVFMRMHGEGWIAALLCSVATYAFLVLLVDRILRLPLPEPWWPLW